MRYPTAATELLRRLPSYKVNEIHIDEAFKDHLEKNQNEITGAARPKCRRQMSVLPRQSIGKSHKMSWLLKKKV